MNRNTLVRSAALAACIAAPAFAEDIGSLTLFGQRYNITRLDYSQVTWPDPLFPGFNLNLIEVEGAHWLGNDRLLLSTDAGDSLLSVKNWVLEVQILRDPSGAPTGLQFVRAVIANDPFAPGYGGFDLSVCGVTINSTLTGLAPGGYLVGNSETNRVDGYNLDGSSAGDFPGGIENDSFDDLAFCPTNGLVYTINENGYRLVTYSTSGAFVASTPLLGMSAIAPGTLAEGSHKGMCFLPDATTVPASIRRAGGTMLLTIDDNNPGLQAYALDGTLLATEPLTTNPVTIGTSLLNQGVDCGNPLQLEACAFDPATGTILLVNEGAFTDCSGFYVLIPDTSCPSDFNNDGGVDGDDVIAFFAAWDAGDLSADFNGDGGVDGDDVIGFFAAWDSGC
jgi:hypothetical protein